jgi:hypothetical protein
MTAEKFFIPEPLYRLLPLIYISVGILAPLYVSSIMSVLSGLLLISAGVLVIMWRAAAKARRRRVSRRFHGRLSSDSTSVSNRRRS